MVGKNIKHLREAKGMTQEQLAEKLNVTRQAVSNWENEKTQPDIDTLHRISQELDASVEELIYGTKPRSATTVIQQVIPQPAQTVKKGLSFGAALAMVISYVNWHSIGWAILHGLFNWFYVLYFLIKYGWH